MACKTSPTPAPTTVPLMRMYCRSRPRSSSSARRLGGVPPLDGSGDKIGELVVELTGEGAGSGFDHTLQAVGEAAV